MQNYGIYDYYTMLSKKGIIFTIRFFFDCHFYDVLNGTDTHYMASTPEGGYGYMASSTSVIRYAFKKTFEILCDFDRYVFIDLGCGKGKVSLVWFDELKSRGLKQKLVLFDINTDLVSIAKNNFKKVFNSNEVEFLSGDATKFDYNKYESPLIIFMYSALRRPTMEKFLEKLQGVSCILIYSNPIHHELLLENQFLVKHSVRQLSNKKLFKLVIYKKSY